MNQTLTAEQKRVAKQLVGSLEQLFAGGEQVVTSEADLEARTHDVTLVVRGPKPLASVYAENEGDIVKTLKWATQNNVKVIPFAAGSSLEGHIVPLPAPLNTLEPVIVLDVSKMNELVEVRRHDLDCDVQPGMGWMELEGRLKPHGLCELKLNGLFPHPLLTFFVCYLTFTWLLKSQHLASTQFSLPIRAQLPLSAACAAHRVPEPSRGDMVP